MLMAAFTNRPVTRSDKGRPKSVGTPSDTVSKAGALTVVKPSQRTSKS